MLGVHRAFAGRVGDRDVRAELAGRAHEQRRRPGVEPGRVADDQPDGHADPLVECACLLGRGQDQFERLPDAGLDRADEPPSTTGPPEITTRPRPVRRAAPGRSCWRGSPSRGRPRSRPRAAVCTADRRGDPVGVRAERAVGRTTHRLERDVIPAIWRASSTTPREAAGMGYDDDPDERRGRPRARTTMLLEVREPADGVRRPRGSRPCSTQSKVRVTAFFQSRTPSRARRVHLGRPLLVLRPVWRGGPRPRPRSRPPGRPHRPRPGRSSRRPAAG